MFLSWFQESFHGLFDLLKQIRPNYLLFLLNCMFFDSLTIETSISALTSCWKWSHFWNCYEMISLNSRILKLTLLWSATFYLSVEQFMSIFELTITECWLTVSRLQSRAVPCFSGRLLTNLGFKIYNFCRWWWHMFMMVKKFGVSRHVLNVFMSAINFFVKAGFALSKKARSCNKFSLRAFTNGHSSLIYFENKI